MPRGLGRVSAARDADTSRTSDPSCDAASDAILEAASAASDALCVEQEAVAAALVEQATQPVKIGRRASSSSSSSPTRSAPQLGTGGLLGVAGVTCVLLVLVLKLFGLPQGQGNGALSPGPKPKGMVSFDRPPYTLHPTRKLGATPPQPHANKKKNPTPPQPSSPIARSAERRRARPPFLSTLAVPPSAKLKGRTAICTIAKDIARRHGKAGRKAGLHGKAGPTMFETFRRAATGLGDVFAEYKIIVVESNSVDNSRQLLTEWQAQANGTVQLLLEPNGKPAQEFAHWRNLYLAEVREAQPPYDYMVVVDPDLTFIDVDGFRDALRSYGQSFWGALTANGVRPRDLSYYDIFAFRNYQWSWSPEHGDSDSMKWSLGGVDGDPRTSPTAKFEIKIGPQWPPMLIQTGFAGMAVYRVKYIEGCDYCMNNCTLKEGFRFAWSNKPRLNSQRSDPHEGKGSRVCEHVPFTDCITRRNGAPIYLVPTIKPRWHYPCADCGCKCAPDFTNTSDGGHGVILGLG